MNRKYLSLTITLFLVEVGIALFIKDTMVRPFVGDVLVVGLIYCFWRIFLKIDCWKVALGVLLFACLIEILQYFDYVQVTRRGKNNRVLSIALGRTFEWTDFMAYFTGVGLIMLAEKLAKKQNL